MHVQPNYNRPITHNVKKVIPAVLGQTKIHVLLTNCPCCVITDLNANL
jgi:hypothetical protein